jgi:hypothetical protein
MDDFEIFRKLAMCEDKEQMQRCIDEYSLSQKPMTNADHIRAMSDEELAYLVRAIINAEDCPIYERDCDDCFFKEVCWHSEKWYGNEVEWLQQPAEY